MDHHTVTPSGYSHPAGSSLLTTQTGAPATDFPTNTAILGAFDDTTFLYYAGTFPGTQYVNFTTYYTNNVTTGQVFEALNVADRQESSLAVGSFYPAQITGYVGGVAHQLNDYMHFRHDYGFGPFAPNFYERTTAAADGTPWAACDRFEVTWALWAFGQVTADGIIYPYGTVPTYVAKLSWAVLEQHYTTIPTVANIAPSTTTVTTPQPTVTWGTFLSPQSSYQAAIIPSGTVDSNGALVGSANFDPERVDLLYKGWISGKIASLSGRDPSLHALLDGTYRAYVRVWTPSPYYGEIASRWYAGSTFTVDADNVNPPAVSVLNDAATYTVKTTIAPGGPVPGGVNPQLYEVQYLDPVAGWVPADVAGGVTTGNATTQFFDGTKRPGSVVSYRARGRYVRSDSATAVTDWVTATATVVDRQEWWLRAVTDYTLNRSLSSFSGLLVKTWTPSRHRPQSVDYGIGAKYPTVVHDVTKASTHELTVWAFSKAAVADLTALLDHDGDLVLTSPWAEYWRVQVGEDVSEEAVAAGPRPGETSALGVVRVVNFTLIEVGY